MALYFYDYNNKRDYKTKLIGETLRIRLKRDIQLADLEGEGVNYFIIFIYKEWEAHKIFSGKYKTVNLIKNETQIFESNCTVVLPITNSNSIKKNNQK